VRKLISLVILLFCASGFSQNCELLFPVKSGGKWGFINKKGELVIKAKYEYAASDFFCSVNIVKDSGSYFLIDNSGKQVGSRYAKYSVDHTNKIILWQNSHDKWGATDTIGKVLVPFLYSYLYFSDGIGNADINDSIHGYIDLKGNFTVLLGYDHLSNLNEGYLLVTKKTATGQLMCGIYSTKQNKVTVELRYKHIDPVKEGHTVVFDNSTEGYGILDVSTGKYSLKPKKGQFIMTSRYNPDLTKYIKTDNLYYVEHKNKARITGPDGKPLSDKSFEDCTILGFYNSYGIMIKNKKEGLVDITGKVVIEPLYDRMLLNSDGLVPVMNNKKWGFLNLKGDTLAPFIFDFAFPCLNGMAQVFEGGNDYSDIYSNSKCRMGYIDKTGKLIWKPSN
jgi:hypothetical protein